MSVKFFILIILLIILISLGSALFHLIRGKSTGEQMARALTIRVGLSVLLIAFIVVAAALGWISPHGAIPVVPRAGG